MKKPTTHKAFARNRQVEIYISYGCAAIIALLPLHAFLAVWLSSVVGHYTLLRLWKEFVLLALALVVAGLIIRKLAAGFDWQGWLRVRPLALLLIAYFILLAGMGLAALVIGDVTLKSLAYGVLLDGRYLVFFVICWFAARRSDWLAAHWRQLLRVPAAIVVVFGLLQFLVLPPDFLRHFGYGPDTIAAAQTVDQKLDYQRIQSTLRGANPLGAYLIVILSAVMALLLRPLRRQWRLVGFGALLGTLAALGATYSRSAWVGAVVALAVMLWLRLSPDQVPAKFARARQLLLVIAATLVLVVAGLGYSLRNNDIVQNTLLHTDEHSRSSLSSNQGHIVAAKAALTDITREPLGKGTGTAGPASFYNQPHAPRIAENYYLQIGQEIGVAGMVLFAAINIGVAIKLWQRKGLFLAQILLASLVGISVVNLLSHAWTDDTLSYIWWGLAGVAWAVPKTAVAPKSK